MNGAVQGLTRNINVTTVVSVVAGMAVFGGIMYVAVKSGIKPLKKAASIAKGAAK